MKKILLLFLSLLLLAGCSLVKLEDKDILQIVDENLSIDNKMHNTVFNGYNLYVPRGLKVNEKNDYNIIITDNENTYYLYVDVVSYYYKVEKDIDVFNDAYISKRLSYNGKFGYINLFDRGENYFVEYMYNYSKIEAFVDKDYIKNAVMNMSYILNSIKYNDSVINDMLGENVLDFQEETVDIFKSKKDSDKFLQYIEYDNNKYSDEDEEEEENEQYNIND